MSRTELKHKKLLFIGGGNIAGAVACGLVSSNAIPAEFVTVFDINDAQFSKFNVLGIKTSNTLSEAANGAEIIFLAVKPNIVSTVMRQLAEIDGLLEKVLIVSFAAAVPIEHIERSAGKELAIIRTMPSTPILVGEGVLAVTANERVKEREFQDFCRMMSSIAFVTVIDESEMNPVIAVNGSSPAYVYLFIKAMLDAAVEQGIQRDAALPLILKTVKGSVKMIEKSKDSIETLIQNVASPNGTTLAALNSFKEDDFCGSISRAMNACTKRANEISLEL